MSIHYEEEEEEQMSSGCGDTRTTSCNPSAWEAATGLLLIWGHSGLYSKALSPKNQLKTNGAAKKKYLQTLGKCSVYLSKMG